MKKIILVSMAIGAFIFLNSSCNKKTRSVDETVYNFDWTSDGQTFYAEHDTNNRAILAKDAIIIPGSSFQLPFIDEIDAKTWSINASTISSITNVAGNRGSAIVSGALLQTQYTITHSLGYTPTMIFIQPKSANAAVPSWVDNITSTTFRITFASVPVLGTNNISFNWIAYKN